MIHAPDDWMKLIKKILRFHLEDGQRVILFGSRATGVRLKNHSDFDFCVRGEAKQDWRVMMELREGFVHSSLPVRVDVVDWHEAPPFLKEAIDKDGIEIDYQSKE